MRFTGSFPLHTPTRDGRRIRTLTDNRRGRQLPVYADLSRLPRFALIDIDLRGSGSAGVIDTIRFCEDRVYVGGDIDPVGLGSNAWFLAPDLANIDHHGDGEMSGFLMGVFLTRESAWEDEQPIRFGTTLESGPDGPLIVDDDTVAMPSSYEFPWLTTLSKLPGTDPDVAREARILLGAFDRLRTGSERAARELATTKSQLADAHATLGSIARQSLEHVTDDAPSPRCKKCQGTGTVWLGRACLTCHGTGEAPSRQRGPDG